MISLGGSGFGSLVSCSQAVGQGCSHLETQLSAECLLPGLLTGLLEAFARHRFGSGLSLGLSQGLQGLAAGFAQCV